MRVNRALKIAVTTALAAASFAAYTQEAPATTELETIIVTGTYIKGTAEDAALPVDVITTEDLQKQGSRTMVDLVKSIPSVQAVVGESNQFGVANAAGTSTVNLRGLGSARTLVLLNGRRLVGAPIAVGGVDLNLLPVAAIGRIEILKDGAAATYGSDAIAGVVNFITNDRLSGFAIDGSYTRVEEADGSFDASISYGWQGDGNRFMLSAGYRHRGELRTVDRPEWALKPFTANTLGGWSSGAITYQTSPSPLNTATRFLDPGCAGFGGFVLSASQCFFQFSAYDNLVEEEDHYQVYGEYNQELFDAVELHVEAHYAMHDVPEEATSPSYSPTQGPSSTPSLLFIPYVPGNAAISNPGLVQFVADNPARLAAISAAGGVYASQNLWRPFSFGANPVTGRQQFNSRQFDAFRVSVGLKGDVGDNLHWDTAVTYMENGSEIESPDALISRLSLALRGLGGPNCTSATPGAPGCLWLNPFLNGVAQSGALGVPNPNGNFNAATIASNAEVFAWATVPNSYEATTKLLVVDAVLSGEIDALSLPGGPVSWAAGAQYRDNGFVRDVSDFSNVAVNPCPVLGDTTCAVQTGALSFFGPLNNQDLSQDVAAVFGELSLPIFDSLQAQLAVRHEDYGGQVGATTNPKLSVRWQALDFLTVRGSAGTTFRGPPETSLDPSPITALLNAYTSFKPFDTLGSADLKPEQAKTFNVGFLVKAGGFNASVDYFNFVFEDALTTENGLQLARAFFGAESTANPGGAAFAGGSTARCTDPAYAALRARFTFVGGVCADGTQLVRTRAYQINSTSDTEISGIDGSLAYVFEELVGGRFTVGADGTYTLKYEQGDNYVEGILIDAAQDSVGTRGGRAGVQVKLKGNGYFDYAHGNHNIRATARYTEGVRDLQQLALADGTPGKEVGSFLTYDLVYRVELPANVHASLSVFNVMDTEPPFARLTLNYEPFIANPLGRYIKVGAGVKF